ncbi:UvrD-helicase domain-containing protein [Kamptonema cortianum]|nr:UvrD-helicase domain-containing protein [Geitlerinema splendidum]MDK3157701.1 UvrD-helicase domain-containing protein [Kamptonema cortianum]
MRIDADQQIAIESTEEKLAVVASAGAGKTTVITERFVRLVAERGLNADQILTVTFTRKAAAEMKRRVVRRLKELGLDDQAQIAETGPIQTIHSFCERLLRENAFLAGIDPDFEVLQSSDSELLWKSCLREVLQSNLREDFAVRNLLRMLAGLGGYRLGDSLDDNVFQASIDQFAMIARGTVLSLEELDSIYESAASYERAVRRQLLEEYPWFGEVSGDALTLGEWLDAIRRVSDRKRVPNWLKNMTIAGVDEETPHSYAIGRIGIEAWRLYELELHDSQKFDFTALERVALRLVEHNYLVREHLASQFSAILIDESQDVNPVQHRLIEMLGISNSLIVGDVQQSIYGFRQADTRLFQEITESRKTIQLRSNYRSQAGILRFVNDTFREIWQGNYGEMLPGVIDEETDEKYSGVELWVTQPREWTKVANLIQEEWAEIPTGQSLTVLVRFGYEAQDLATELEARQIPHEIAGGTAKFYARMEARDIANALACASQPLDDFALLAFLRSPFVGLSLDSIVLLAESKPVFNHLSEFVTEIDDDARKLRGLMEWFPEVITTADRLPAWELLNELFHKSPYLETIASRPNAEQLLANSRKLLMLAASHPELSGRQFADRIRNVSALRHKEGDAPTFDEDDQVVRIMTIHKAKGLEFDRVIVAGVFGSNQPRNSPLRADMQTGIVAHRSSRGIAAIHAWLTENEAAQSKEEALRILYVAATRAKQKLCLCVPQDMNARNIPQTLAFAIARACGYPGNVPSSIKVKGLDSVELNLR